MYDPVERRNFYGRIHGKTLRDSQKTYLAEDLEALSLKGVTREDNPERTPIDLSRFDGKPLWLEIGFGGGEHLALPRPIYARTAAYGHFGRAPDADGGFSWEKTDLIEALKAAV